ncbi:DNA polymerase I [Candidatus Marinamargulisbacteria bacterium SCGC AG-410-N11]|nr:DNA polymerase I [Candidatus Marinamargulisbacteria bacterium SCGC AG-410-N11]
MPNKLLIIDALSLAFRAYYSYPPSLTDNNGNPINAVFGFITLLFKGLEDLKPTHLCVCFDRKEPTFRHKQYSEYKANRPPAPEDFISQVILLKDVLSRINIHQVECAGYEADDLIGTIAQQANSENIETIILTGDQDALQLVTPTVTVAMNKKGVSNLVLFTPGLVKEKYGILPEQVIDYKALKGDSSDNIPGVKGIGDKTAVKLLSEFKTIENIYKNLTLIESKSIKSKLEQDQNNAYLSKVLATINCEAPINRDINGLKFSVPWMNAYSLFKEFKFNTLLRKYENNFSNIIKNQNSSVEYNYKIIKKLDDLQSLLPSLENGFAIDLETTSLNTNKAQIVGISITFKKYSGWYIPLNKYIESENYEGMTPLFKEATNTDKIEFKCNPFLNALKPYLENHNIKKMTHNGKYEWLVFQNYNINLTGIEFDTMIAAFLIDPSQPVGLKSLAFQHLSRKMTSFKELLGDKNQNHNNIKDIPVEKVAEYAIADSDVTWQLYELFLPQLMDKGLWPLFKDIEMPVQIILGEMERTGVCIDPNYLMELSKQVIQAIKRLEESIYSESKAVFNINSTKQLSEVLFEKMKLPVIKKTKTGTATNSAVLEKLKKDHKIAALILEYRHLEKLRNTYIDVLPQLVDSYTNRVHTSFNQTIVVTGRLSSSSPNLQNIPIRTELGKNIRKAFIPSHPDNSIVSIDYSQIELRLIAHLSKDKNMIEAFCNNEDIHRSTASIIFQCDKNDVDPEQRYRAKAVNFGILYGISAFGLSENIGITKLAAKEMIENYYNNFPSIKQFMAETVEYAKENGYVKTEFGRIREIPDIKSNNVSKRNFAERTAINTRVQGTSADIMKKAMINVLSSIKDAQLKSKMIIQVHDELVFDVPNDELDQLIRIAKDEMERIVNYLVPLKTDVEVGPNWKDLKNYKE